MWIKWHPIYCSHIQINNHSRGLLLGQYLKKISNTVQDTFAFLMTRLNSLPNQGRNFSFTLRGNYSSSTSLSLFVCSFDVCGFDTRLNAVKKKKKTWEKESHFHLFSTLPSLLPPHVMVKHTPMLKCHLQVVLAKMSDEIRNDERLRAQTKEKFPWRYGSFLGSARRKVMKHLSGRNVKPNQRSRGQQRNVQIIKLASLTQPTLRSAKRLSIAAPHG